MNGQYRTIVADPPWQYGKWGKFPYTYRESKRAYAQNPRPLPYAALSVEDICALPVRELVESDAHLYLWTTGRYLPHAFRVIEAWGFRYAQPLVWTKAPRGASVGGAFTPTTEFVLFARRGTLAARTRIPTTWFAWKRATTHSTKPEAFQDLVEQVSPGPYLELFARRPRLGWDVWGNEVESSIEMAAD